MNFSEENPGEYKSTEKFVIGLSCRGKECDDISLRMISTPNLKSTGQCYSSPYFSEEPPSYRECKNGYFLSGLACSGDNCDDISLYCCHAQYPLSR